MSQWTEAALTSLSFFYKAFWAFTLGYLISSMIQVFVTRERMKRVIGKESPRSIAVGTFFGFISSSCSFAALATTKALLKKGSGLISAMAFLLASTNLVIELGIVISIFLSWHFVVGEYAGGILLILIASTIVFLLYPKNIMQAVRKRLNREKQVGESDSNKAATMVSLLVWRKVAQQFFMEWKMVWKDVTLGFTVAGIIAAMVPPSFFQWLFPGSGNPSPGLLDIILQTLVGPLAAFFTFIGSMGNIPLAAILYDRGVSFAGIMAFIFSDLMVFPVLRINAKYYGWKMALYMAGVLFCSLVLSALMLHGAFSLLSILPPPSTSIETSRRLFSWNYTAYLNIVAVLLTLIFTLLAGREFWKKRLQEFSLSRNGDVNWMERVLLVLAVASLIWLATGLMPSSVLKIFQLAPPN